MHFTPAFVLAALPFLGLVAGAVVDAPAAPVEERAEKVSIGINKRSRLAHADGSVNPAALKAHVARTTAKIERGFAAYERNMGHLHPLASTQVGTSKRTVGNEALTDDEEELWYGTISVGTPAVKYTVDFDTGSSVCCAALLE
jgi:cathepsin D